jgi:arylsulfatase A-like enzyme
VSAAGRARSLAASLVVCVAAALSAGCGDRAQPRGNLLLISIDTLRADALGVYGSERGASPLLDRWAEGAVVFDSAWSSSPKTAPAHMSMFTGEPPRVHGVGNLGTAGASRLPASLSPLAEVLRGEGFSTAAFTDGGNVRAELGFDRGFQTYAARLGGLPDKLRALSSWLSRRDGERWFAFLHTYHVHDPYLAGDAWAGRFADEDYGGEIVGDRARLRALMEGGGDLAPGQHGHDGLVANFWMRVDEEDPADLAHLHDLYTALVASLDRTLAPFLDQLEADGLLDDTLVVITSDHGEEFGEHGGVRHEQLWSEVLRVPLIVRLPGGRAGRVARPVRHEDLTPSLLELLGVPDPAGPRWGTSWAGWLDDPEAAEAEPERPRIAEHRSRRERDLDLWSVRHGDWLLVLDRAGEAQRDLAADPGELVPAEDPARAAALRELYLRELARMREQAQRLGRGDAVELDDETRRELEALGYL